MLCPIAGAWIRLLEENDMRSSAGLSMQQRIGARAYDTLRSIWRRVFSKDINDSSISPHENNGMVTHARGCHPPVSSK